MDELASAWVVDPEQPNMKHVVIVRDIVEARVGRVRRRARA